MKYTLHTNIIWKNVERQQLARLKKLAAEIMQACISAWDLVYTRLVKTGIIS